MKLLTVAQRAKLLDNGRRQAAVKGSENELDPWPVVKLFNPCGAATWLLTEIDPDDETVAWGLCDLGMGWCAEFGTVSLSELAAYRGRLGLGTGANLGLHHGGEQRWADRGEYPPMRNRRLIGWEARTRGPPFRLFPNIAKAFC